MTGDAPADDPAARDPRAFRMTSADGQAIAVYLGDDGQARISVGGAVALLTSGQARKLGARVMGAGRRARPIATRRDGPG